jgi:D-serine deaminase-like pyridoxal phosphate-dependent protein
MIYKPELGVPTSQLDTPALLIDLDALERNIGRMAAYFAARPVALRPHAKTHKCPEIALRQLAAGAIGITCAKLGEAEVMAAAGVRDILIANQITGRIKIDRLTDLAARCDLMVAVDDAENVAALGAACAAKSVTLRVLVEVDIGMGRCGVRPGGAALALARQVVDLPWLQFAGLMGYEGHLVMVADLDERRARVREAFRGLEETRELLEQGGLPVAIVSGGGTGTYDLTSEEASVTEIQAGSYVLMDSTYQGIRPEFEPALTLLTTVVSRPEPDRLVTDAGLKMVTKEFGWPAPLDIPSARVQYLSEEHGVLSLSDPAGVALRPGDKMRFLPSHCCTTVNLHDRYYVVQDGRLVDTWSVAGRGRSQ